MSYIRVEGLSSEVKILMLGEWKGFGGHVWEIWLNRSYKNIL